MNRRLPRRTRSNSADMDTDPGGEPSGRCGPDDKGEEWVGRRCVEMEASSGARCDLGDLEGGRGITRGQP
ncbi:hypothetical protein NL676_012761 [Syzygium grande]|nr:hypothetical protein NL676_012761 [Syzygium grande]